MKAASLYAALVTSAFRMPGLEKMGWKKSCRRGAGG
jgi:hypothetical protein